MIDTKKFEQFIKERNKFSGETFGSPEERDCMGPLYHLREEIDELIDNPNDTSEWADCLLLLLDAAWRKGHTFDELVGFAMAKLEVNKKRTWEKSVNGIYKHVE